MCVNEFLKHGSLCHRLHHIIGSEPLALNHLSNGRIHAEEFRDAEGPLQSASGPSQGKVRCRMKNLLPRFEDFQGISGSNAG